MIVVLRRRKAHSMICLRSVRGAGAHFEAGALVGRSGRLCSLTNGAAPRGARLHTCAHMHARSLLSSLPSACMAMAGTDDDQ
jgi:hypothetical protein